MQQGKNNVLKRSTNVVANNKDGTAFELKMYAYNDNYKGKNPMTRIQKGRRRKSGRNNTKNFDNWAPNEEPNEGELCSLTLGKDESGHPI